MSTTDHVSDLLKSLPPPLPDEPGRFDRVHARVRSRRRRSAATVLSALAVATVGGWAILQGLEGPTATGPAGDPGQRVVENAGGTAVTLLGEPVLHNGTGTETVQLGPPPSEATAVSLVVACLSGGTLVFPDGASMTCPKGVDAEAATATSAFPTTYTVPLDPGQDSLVLTADEGMRWRASVQYASTEVVPWGVNARGQTYGQENEDGLPDLVAVVATNGRMGFAESAALEAAAGPQPTSPEQALEWQALPVATVEVPVYEVDGTTQIGVFEVSSRAPADPGATG